MTGFYGKKTLVGLICIFLSGGVCFGESLWKPGFRGYAASGGGYAQGDIVSVVLDASSSLSLNSFLRSSDSTQMSFSGSEAEGLISFLPQGQASSDRSVEGQHDLSLSAVLAVRVVDQDASGALRLQGSRQVVLDGTVETITLEGTAMAGAIKDGRIRFEELAESRLEWESNAFPGRQVLGEGDLSWPERPSESPGEAVAREDLEEELPATLEDPSDEGAVPAQSADSDSMEISRQRRNELLQQYMNRFLQLLFAGE